MPLNQPQKLDEAERRAELIDQSRELCRLFGFEKGKKVETDELKLLLEKYRSRVKNALLLVYEHRDIRTGVELSEQTEVQLAFLMNIQKMVEFDRTRKTGDPYYVHPLSVSQRLVDYPPDDSKSLQEGIIGALLHDYLEEGEGVSAENIASLKRIFSGFSSEMAGDLALLTEPNYIEHGKKERPELEAAIDYDSLNKKFGKNRKTLETIIFSLMMKKSKLMQLVVPYDKMDNISDCDIIQKKKASKEAASPEEFNRKYLENMAKVLATTLLYAEQCTSPEAAATKSALIEKVTGKISQMEKSDPVLSKLEDAVKAKLKEYHDLLDNKELMSELIKELKNYSKSLGLDDFAKRLEA